MNKEKIIIKGNCNSDVVYKIKNVRGNNIYIKEGASIKKKSSEREENIVMNRCTVALNRLEKERKTDLLNQNKNIQRTHFISPNSSKKVLVKKKNGYNEKKIGERF